MNTNNIWTAYLFFLFCFSARAQQANYQTQISFQTDLLAYTTPGGFSIWLCGIHKQNDLSLAFINYPNRDKKMYEETGIKETDRFIRAGYSRYFNPEGKLKNFFIGTIFQFHWRLLEQQVTSEQLTDTYIQFGPIIGWSWHPWNNKDNFSQNFSIKLWGGPVFRPYWYRQDRIFEQTGIVYDAPSSSISPAIGINVGYTLFKK